MACIKAAIPIGYTCYDNCSVYHYTLCLMMLLFVQYHRLWTGSSILTRYSNFIFIFSANVSGRLFHWHRREPPIVLNWILKTVIGDERFTSISNYEDSIYTVFSSVVYSSDTRRIYVRIGLSKCRCLIRNLTIPVEINYLLKQYYMI